MKIKFLTYGILSMLLVASACKRQDEVLPEETSEPTSFKNGPGVLSANPTDQELLRLPEIMVKTPVKRTLTKEGDELLQRDMSYYMETTVTPKISSNSDHGHDHKDAQLEASLNRPHPSVKTLHKYFNEAANEFKVPVALLMAIAQVQSNWTQVGESMYGSWGIMGLIENQFVQQLSEASGMLGVSPQQIKDDARTNIRAAAALLAKYQSNTGSQRLEDWFDATKQLSGIPENKYSEQLAQRYYDLIKKGSKSVTLWGEIINIGSERVNISNKLKDLENIQASSGKGASVIMKAPSSATISAVDYPGAVEDLTTCNYSSRNGATIGYYFVHYVATGTYQNAISWFKNCNAQASAHYIVRNSDGLVTQMVRESNKAWSQGVAFYNERGVAIEHEVLASNLAMWYSEPMLTSAGNLARNVCDRRGIPKVRAVAAPGINGHSDVKATSCPNMTSAVWNLFMAHVNPTTGGVFDAFNTNVGRFNTAPTYSGSTVGIATTSTASWDSGSASLKVTLNDNTSVTTPWFVRLLSGVGTPANNVSSPKTGTLHFTLKTSTAQPGATVRIWVDDSDGTEQSPPITVINDGVAHTYSWNLSSFGGTGVTGNGVIDAANVTLDAIILQQPNTATPWVSYIDNVGN